MADALSQPFGEVAGADSTVVAPALLAQPPPIASAVAHVLQGAPFIALVASDAATSRAATAALTAALTRESLRVLSVRRGDSDGLRLTAIAAQLLDKPEAAFDPDDIERLFEILTDPAGSGQPVVLMIDGAEALQQDVINYLRLLSTLASHAAPRIVFVGQPTLWQAIAALKDLISAHWVLGPADEAALRVQGPVATSAPLPSTEPVKTPGNPPPAAATVASAPTVTGRPSPFPIPVFDRKPSDASPPAISAGVTQIEPSLAASLLKVPAQPTAAPASKLPAQPVRPSVAVPAMGLPVPTVLAPPPALPALKQPTHAPVTLAAVPPAVGLATSRTSSPLAAPWASQPPAPRIEGLAASNVSPLPAAPTVGRGTPKMSPLPPAPSALQQPMQAPAYPDLTATPLPTSASVERISSAPAAPAIGPVADAPVPEHALRYRGVRYAAALVGASLLVYAAAEAAKRLDVATTVRALLATNSLRHPAPVAIPPPPLPGPAPRADARPPDAAVAEPPSTPSPSTLAQPRPDAPARIPPLAEASAPGPRPEAPVAAAPQPTPVAIPPPGPPPGPGLATAPTAVRPLPEASVVTALPIPPQSPPQTAAPVQPAQPAETPAHSESPAQVEAASQAPLVVAPNSATPAAAPTQSAADVVAAPAEPPPQAAALNPIAPPRQATSSQGDPAQASSPAASTAPATIQPVTPPPASIQPASAAPPLPATSAAPSSAAPSSAASIPSAVIPPPASQQTTAIPPTVTQPLPPSAHPTALAARPASTMEKPDPPDIRALITRGDSLLAIGDIVAARLLYERAASLGSGRAATAVGKTYDPQELARLNVTGPKADASVAATWYRSGATLGDPEATGMLRHLNEGEPAK